MEKHVKLTKSSVGALTATAAVALGMLAAPTAFAQGGGSGGGSGSGSGSGSRLGPAVSTSGTGTLGSPWTLKSQHDDDGPGPVVGEEFEIKTPAGHVWTVTLADNGTSFFSQDVTADATGLKAMSKTADLGIDQHMSAHAVDKATGEVVDGAVDLPAL
ncbi:hypothetical protein [Kribbella sp. NBC_00359]|uniref:hypothetical protein n=1 Tax=Kribbella sp. NBC_00359 TaxID=2975966 RepID=UPI002E224EE1